MEPLRLARRLLDQAASVADQLAQLALAAIRDEAALEQAVAGAGRRSTRRRGRRSCARDGLDVAGVDDEELEAGWNVNDSSLRASRIRERQSVVPQAAGIKLTHWLVALRQPDLSSPATGDFPPWWPWPRGTNSGSGNYPARRGTPHHSSPE